MLASEYDAMMAAKGTPKVWMVSYAITCPGMVHSEVFKTEDEARAFAEKQSHVVSIGQVWDIWNWTARHNQKNGR